jgi:hypothetical protein
MNGTNFVPGSLVSWNGGALATTFISSSQLTAVVPASDIASPNTASVVALNPGPGGGSSNVDFFQSTTPSSGVVFKTSTVDGGQDTPGVVVADLNGDGKLDMVTVISNQIGVRLGNGDGTFQTEVHYATAVTQVGGPVLADFNGDGKLDVAVVCYKVVSVLLGNGDGTFRPHVDFPIDVFPTSGAFTANQVAAADFNGDGKLDLAVGYQVVESNAVSILIGNGDGTFQPPVDYPTGNEPDAIGVADLNHDGKLDIVTANWGDFGGTTVSVLLGNGDGTFQPQVQYSTAMGPVNLQVADFNGDGNVDLAVICPCGNGSTCSSLGVVSILLGRGDGTFQSRVDYPVYPLDGFPGNVSVGDYNGDGKLDLLVTIANTGQVSLLLGNGDGTFGAGKLYGPTQANPVSVAPGDFNGDGALDAIIGASGGLTTLLQVPTASVSPTNLTFVTQLVRTTSTPQIVTLTNSSSAILTISSIVTSGDFRQTNTCGSSVPPAGSCTIDVTFQPTSKGKRNGTLTITDSAANSPQTVALTGTGTVVQLSAAAIKFGGQEVGTTSQPQALTLTNTDTTVLIIRGIAIGGTNFGDFLDNTTCGSSLASKASCLIQVRFRPTATGKRNASLDVLDDGGGSPQHVKLSGTGTQ